MVHTTILGCPNLGLLSCVLDNEFNLPVPLNLISFGLETAVLGTIGASISRGFGVLGLESTLGLIL